MSQPPGLFVEGLSVDRGGRPVLRDLSFHLAPGAALMVSGSNGAGKSTLLRALAGLIPRVGGKIVLRLDETPKGVSLVPQEEKTNFAEGETRVRSRVLLEGGRDPSPGASRHLLPQGEKGSVTEGASDADHGAKKSGAALVDLAEHTHYLGHANALKLALTVVENLRFAAAWGGGGLTPAEALAAVSLAHVAEFPAGILSAGQRRRVALARLLVARRGLWLLDEPAAALDVAAEAVLAGLMRAHLERGGLIVAAIHAPLDLPAGALRLGA